MPYLKKVHAEDPLIEAAPADSVLRRVSVVRVCMCECVWGYVSAHARVRTRVHTGCDVWG